MRLVHLCVCVRPHALRVGITIRAQMSDILCPSRFAPQPASCPPRTLILGAHQPDSCLASGWVRPLGSLASRSEGGGLDRLAPSPPSCGSAVVVVGGSERCNFFWPVLCKATALTNSHMALSPDPSGQGLQPGSLLLLAPRCITIAPVSLYPTLTFVNGPFITFCWFCLSVPTASC